MTELDLHTMAEELINAKNVQDTNKDWKWLVTLVDVKYFMTNMFRQSTQSNWGKSELWFSFYQVFFSKLKLDELV